MQYKTKPMEHQARAIEWGYNREYLALFCEQGTGKSKTTIDLASN